jgi:hypothetical protein
MRKVYRIDTYIPYEGGWTHGIYSSPAAVAAFFDDSGWDDDSMGVTVHVLDGALLDPDYDTDGKAVPKEKFKPLSEMS